MQLKHRLSALLQLHLHSRLNTWLQWIGQRRLQDEMRIILGIRASYIRDFTVTPLLTHWNYCSLALSHRYSVSWHYVQGSRGECCGWSHCTHILQGWLLYWHRGNRMIAPVPTEQPLDRWTPETHNPPYAIMMAKDALGPGHQQPWC